MSRAQQFEIAASGALYNGSVLTSGYLKFYAAGTTTAKNAYEDKNKSVSCTKKALDAQGRAEVYGDGVYKIELYEGDPDNGGTLRDTIDNYKCTAVVGNRVTVTDDYTADRDDELILVDTTSKTITISLDDVNNFDNPITIKKINAANTVTIDPYSTQTVDGSSTISLSSNNETVTLNPDTTADIWRRTEVSTLLGLTSTVAELNVLDGITSTVTELNLLDGLATFFYGNYNRAIFTYNGGTTAYTVKVKPGVYFCKDKYCQWSTELTTGAIGTPAADTWYYLYLDYSAITSGTAITNSELVWSTDAPAYNATYRQWLRTSTNTDDRCIFAVLTNSGPSNILEFFHDGGEFVSYGADIADISTTDVDTGWAQDVTLSIPSLSTKALCTFYHKYIDGASEQFWRNKDSAGTGHFLSAAGLVADVDLTVSTIVTTSSAQKITVNHSVSNGNQATVWTNGWFFPIGT